jgi:hypothetical protein
MNVRFRIAWALIAQLVFSWPALTPVARAEDGPPKTAVPDALKPWVAFVQGRNEVPCPLAGDAQLCTYHTALELVVDDRGGTFDMRGSLLRKGALTLPGSTSRWPRDVKVDGKEAVVVMSEGRPSLNLAAGTHAISGRFLWQQLPDTLPIPRQTGLVSLKSRGDTISAPKRDAEGLLWLAKSAQSEAAESDALRISVHRRIDDGVPLRIKTRILLFVAGRAREVLLPKALIAGSRALSLSATLPAELQKDGTLRLHVDAGEHRVELDAIREDLAPSLLADSAPEPWPSQEIWVFSADEPLRHVELSGGTPTDPARTDLAPDFRTGNLATFTVKRGTAFTLDQKRRGESEPAPNKLRLSRTLWLDMDGLGFTAHDALSGSFARDFRLALLEGELGSASVDQQAQMVSMHAGLPGIEVRRNTPRVSADLRFPSATRELRAVGYDQDVEQLSTTLRLPPGHRLLHADGPDAVVGAWAESWNLFDFFFVLLVMLGTGKLVHPMAGLVALVTLVLTHEVSNAPAVGWVVLLATRALVDFTARTRASGLIRRGFYACAGLMALAIVPMSVAQIRAALYPQLEYRADSDFFQETPTWLNDVATDDAEGGKGVAHRDEEAPMEAAREMAAEAAAPAGYDVTSSIVLRKAAAPEPKRAKSAWDMAEPLPVVQTGPGLPNWTFHTYQLVFTGPVQRDQRISFWILPPELSRLWSLLSALCPLALLGLLLRGMVKRDAGAGAALATLALVVVTGFGAVAEAQGMPSPELLGELEKRLQADAACAGEALSVGSLSMRADASTLRVSALVHVACDGVYRAPGPLSQWSPATLRVDGKDGLAIARLDDGFLHVRLGPGIHRVELDGPLPRAPAFTLSLGTPPRYTEVDAKAFVVEGLKPDGQADDSIAFRREVKSEESEKESTTGLTHWVEVARTVRLGVRLTATTEVKRLSPPSEDLLVRVPLLPGESVSEAGLASEQGSVLVKLRRGESSVSYGSTLADAPQLTLEAAVPSDAESGALLHPISEHWTIAPTELYHPTFSGLPPVGLISDDGHYAPHFAPYPGEKLTVGLARVTPAKGAAVTIDSALARFRPGARLESISLDLHVRTSNGSTESIVVPEDAALQSLTINAVARPERIKQGKLVLQLGPGEQNVHVELSRTRGMELSYAPSAIRIGRALSNVTSEIYVPEGRWLLGARGPDFGPAVLFWGYALAVLVFALVLARLPHAPLSAAGFCLLGLGLTQVEVVEALFVVAWLFAIVYREQVEIPGRLRFNFMQLGFVFLGFLALSSLAHAVQSGLVVQPNMQVSGNESTNELLRFYEDQSAGAFPAIRLLSVSIWVYRGLMLVWALWLAFNVLGWLKRAAEAFRQGGMFRPWSKSKLAAPNAETPQ